MQKYILFLLFAVSFSQCMAQNYAWEDFVEDFLQQEDETMSEEERQSLLEDLSEIHQNPFEINNIKKENLQMLPFLDERQMDSIVSYVHRYGPVFSLKELWLIPWLDKKTRDYLSLFLICKDIQGSFYNVREGRIPKSRHQIISNFNIPLYQRQGFKDKKYKGYPFYAAFRYRGQWKDGMEWGLTLQNDEGEPFCSHGNYVFDYQSFYLSGKGKGVLLNWLVGDYKLKFGAGLVAGKGYWNNMTSLLMFPKNTTKTLFKHSSTDEYRYFRGGAVVLGLRAFNLTLFCSYRKHDATMKNNEIATILKTGMHRTSSELDKKGNAGAFSTGFNVEWNKNPCLSLGLSAVYAAYDKRFASSTVLYKKYDMTGKSFGNMGIHYNYTKKSFSIQGEGALDANANVACLNQMTYSPSYYVKMLLLHRYYAKAYNAPYAFAYASRSYVKNEHGVFAGLSINAMRKWNIKTAFDMAFYPYAIYKVSRPSRRSTVFAQAEYMPAENTSFALRYQLRCFQEDNTAKTKLTSLYKHRLKLQSHYQTGVLKHHSALDLSYSTTQGDKPETGIMLSQKTSLKLPRFALSCAGAWFSTTSSSSALYLYEPGPAYAYAYPACFYHGIRGMLMVSGKMMHNLEVAFKYGITYYFNKDTISSSTQLIRHPYKNDVYIQINRKF